MADSGTERKRGPRGMGRQRISLGLRVTPALRDQLVTRAADTGRSITQESELLLEKGLWAENVMNVFGGPEGWRLALMLFSNFTPPFARTFDISQGAPSLDWLKDPVQYETAMKSLIR